MRAEERRQAILNTLLNAGHPVSASALARQFSVSRQIVVGDVALLRAAGANISATPRGYVLETGRIVTSGTGHELLESPAIKKAYLGG